MHEFVDSLDHSGSFDGFLLQVWKPPKSPAVVPLCYHHDIDRSGDGIQ